MYCRKSVGPRMELSGTPALIEYFTNNSQILAPHHLHLSESCLLNVGQILREY